MQLSGDSVNARELHCGVPSTSPDTPLQIMRKAKGWKPVYVRERLAQRGIHVTAPSFTRYEKGQRPIPRKVLRALAELYGVAWAMMREHYPAKDPDSETVQTGMTPPVRTADEDQRSAPGEESTDAVPRDLYTTCAGLVEIYVGTDRNAVKAFAEALPELIRAWKAKRPASGE